MNDLTIQKVSYNPRKGVVKVQYFTPEVKYTAEKVCLPSKEFLTALDSFVDDLLELLEMNDPDHYRYHVNEVVCDADFETVVINGTKHLSRGRICQLITPPTILGIDSDYDNGEALLKKVNNLHTRTIELLELENQLKLII